MSNLYNKYIGSKANAFLAVLGAFLFAFAAPVFADLVIDPGEVYVMAPGETLTVDGSLIISATGTLDASAAGVTINVSDNWSNSGTFMAGTDSTVVLNGTGSQNILGSTTFYNLTATAAFARTLGFEEDQTQTINGHATFTGSAGQLMLLRTVDSSGVILNDGSQAPSISVAP